MTDDAQAIAVTDLHKRFGPLEVLKGVSLTANQGDVIAIIGGSGSGKSTLLRCINMLELPTAGSVSIHGETIAMKKDGRGGLMPSDRKQVERLRAQLGMVLDLGSAEGSAVLETLEAYLDAGCQKTRAAEALHLRRQSLYARLDKAFSVLGGDPTGTPRALPLHLALKLRHSLQTLSG